MATGAGSNVLGSAPIVSDAAARSGTCVVTPEATGLGFGNELAFLSGPNSAENRSGRAGTSSAIFVVC